MLALCLAYVSFRKTTVWSLQIAPLWGLSIVRGRGSVVYMNSGSNLCSGSNFCNRSNLHNGSNLYQRVQTLSSGPTFATGLNIPNIPNYSNYFLFVLFQIFQLIYFNYLFIYLIIYLFINCFIY